MGKTKKRASKTPIHGRTPRQTGKFFQPLREYQSNQKLVQTDQGYQSHQLSTDLDPCRRRKIPLKNGESRLLQSPPPKKKRTINHWFHHFLPFLIV